MGFLLTNIWIEHKKQIRRKQYYENMCSNVLKARSGRYIFIRSFLTSFVLDKHKDFGTKFPSMKCLINFFS